MALYPIKMLKDNKGQYFFPFITDDAILMNGDDRTMGQRLDEIEQSIQDLGTVLKFCGIVSTYEDLPVNGKTGDVYFVESNSSEYVYVNSTWEQLGPVINLSDYYTKSQTDELLNQKQNNLTAGTNVSIENDTINVNLDLNNYYTKAEIDNMIGTINTELETIINGGA